MRRNTILVTQRLILGLGIIPCLLSLEITATGPEEETTRAETSSQIASPAMEAYDSQEVLSFISVLVLFLFFYFFVFLLQLKTTTYKNIKRIAFSWGGVAEGRVEWVRG